MSADFEQVIQELRNMRKEFEKVLSVLPEGYEKLSIHAAVKLLVSEKKKLDSVRDLIETARRKPHLANEHMIKLEKILEKQ